jgi:hypothetical protein
MNLMIGLTAMFFPQEGEAKAPRAKPDPAYMPPYSEDFVLKKLKHTAYGKVLRDNKIKVVSASFRGYSFGPEAKQLMLDLGLELAKSPLGVRYSIGHTVSLDWRTGDVLEPEKERQELLEILYPIANAIARAEMLAEVQQFVREHQGKHRIEAFVKPAYPDCHYISYEVAFSAKDESGEALLFYLYKNGDVQDMVRVYVSKDGETKEVKLR